MCHKVREKELLEKQGNEAEGKCKKNIKHWNFILTSKTPEADLQNRNYPETVMAACKEPEVTKRRHLLNQCQINFIHHSKKQSKTVNRNIRLV